MQSRLQIETFRNHPDFGPLVNTSPLFHSHWFWSDCFREILEKLSFNPNKDKITPYQKLKLMHSLCKYMPIDIPLEVAWRTHTLMRMTFLGLQVTVTSSASMEAPICLVENESEELRVNPEAVNFLEKITQPVVVVAIVGLYRTGKSYLMNRLAGQNHGECCPQTGQRLFVWNQCQCKLIILP